MRNPPPIHSRAGLVRFGLGILFLVLGVIGCFLPILQGFLFLAAGAFLLSPYIRFFRKIKVVLFRRYPRMRRTIHGWQDAWHLRQRDAHRKTHSEPHP